MGGNEAKSRSRGTVANRIWLRSITEIIAYEECDFGLTQILIRMIDIPIRQKPSVFILKKKTSPSLFKYLLSIGKINIFRQYAHWI